MWIIRVHTGEKLFEVFRASISFFESIVAYAFLSLCVHLDFSLGIALIHQQKSDSYILDRNNASV